MELFQHLFGYLPLPRPEFDEIVTSLRERQSTLRDELWFRKRVIGLIDSLGEPLLVLNITESPDIEVHRDAADRNDDRKSDASLVRAVPTLDVYRFAMTLLENISYEHPLSRHQETHQREILEAYPALQDLVDICARNAPVDGWLFSGKKTIAGHADLRTARAAVRSSIESALLAEYRLAEVRAWIEADYQFKCVSTALSYVFFARGSPDDDANVHPRSIIYAMVEDIRSFNTEMQFIPAEPRESDVARIREHRVLFDEIHLGNLIQTFGASSRQYLSKKGDLARQALANAQLPFPLNLPVGGRVVMGN
ncbi:hypothetical protein BOTBODRAFT_39853 [Botryobasidium botryosum FD-172 SS1]|uniref:Uncharacterized protein n=1 Tax=Botryobasidium botryosum (strain FD-172 SS1) TaxID=930990 RepID=A0A067M297_BOTB1|nr:hypothetical protein BOTBODRAFT_39853 [Botryobasidium botryosum FD-172 SS1]